MAVALEQRPSRADRARAVIANALLELVREGDHDPTAPRVAERAGVSLRTVFHHFRNMEAVWELAVGAQQERVRALLRPLPAEGPLEARLEAFVKQRTRVLEAITNTRRAALLHESRSPAIAAGLAAVRRWKRDEAERVFARELAALPAGERREVAAALGATASWSFWEAIRFHQGMTETRARQVLTRALRRLLRR